MKARHFENQRPAPSFRELYPHLTDEERQAAEERLDRYLAIVLQIYERICRDPEARREFHALTGLELDATMMETAQSRPADLTHPTL